MVMLETLNRVESELQTNINNVEASIPNVINNLTSTSTTDALSANQGRELSNLLDLGGVDWWNGGDDGGILFKTGVQMCWNRQSVTLGGNMWNTSTDVWYSDHSMGNWARSFSWLVCVIPSVRVEQYWATAHDNHSNTSAGTVRVFRPNANTASGYVNVLGIGYG